jgi:hypothetical protein
MQIIFENRKKDDVGNDCLLQVDGTDCKTTNQGASHQAFYSFKFNYGGLRYEVGICIRTGHIAWINGPFPPGDWPDVEVFRSTLKLNLEEGERVETDDGYLGEDPCFTKCPGGVRFMEDQQWHKKRSVVRNRGETANHRLKTFKVLQDTFRHDIEKHSMCFRACAVLAQLSFEVGSKKLFNVPNYDQNLPPEPLGDDDI